MWNKSTKVPNFQKLIEVPCGTTSYHGTKRQKINRSTGTSIQDLRVSIFPESQQFSYQNSTIFETQGKNSRKIENSRLKLNDFDQKTQGTGGFYHLCPRENRTKKKPALQSVCQLTLMSK